MIAGLPLWIEVLFIACCLFTIVVFHLANGRPRKISLFILTWTIAHSLLALNGFYQNTEAFPPRFAWILIPAILIVIWASLPRNTRKIIQKRNAAMSVFIHAVRLPVEIVLWQLFIFEMVPELMTFEGRNFDIIMGITAPLIALLVWLNKIPKGLLLIWNSIGLILVLFILINGILSAELPFQQFAFDQPNRGITYFPFVLLPATIVPIAVWTHLTDIFILLREFNKRSK
ncbi:MAG: hypothetical protein AAF487_06980 [Bacteroidota bacterium]